MLCTIDDFQLADGTISGGFALSGLRFRMQRIAEIVNPVPQPLDNSDPDHPSILIVGMAYRIVVYVPGDDFTGVGGTNVTGAIFIATGTPTAGNWDNGSTLIAISPGIMDRNKRKAEISFTIERVHATIGDAEAYILDHDSTVPRTGDVKLIVSVYGIVSSSPYALIVNGAVISHELVTQYGKFTRHNYRITGAPLFPVIPDQPDHITTEGGDRITTETGDTLVIE